MTLLAADDLLATLEPLGMRLSLAPFRRLLAKLGEPQRQLPAVLVAGTNGKGSTAALLAAIGCAAGYRTGLYTSPHLEEPRERIRVDGLAIATLELDRLLAEVVAAAGDELPTPFEALTAAAFVAFAEAGIELAVLEVGLGGRLDATNACEPLLSVVTPIALDHQEVLGASRGAIAAEKAGVFRRGRPAIVWGEEPESTAALAAAARACGADLELVATTTELVTTGPAAARGRIDLRTPRGEHRLVLALAGAHQRRNAALAVRAAERLAELGFDRLDGPAIARGVAGCRWPGRVETVALPDGTTVLLDGAHNPAGAAILAAHLADQAGPWDLVFGTLADKDTAGMAAVLAPRARQVFLAPPRSPRALPLTVLAALPSLAGAIATADSQEALTHALESAAPLLVVTGSLYLVGEARRWLRDRFGLPPAAAAISTWEPPAGPSQLSGS